MQTKKVDIVNDFHGTLVADPYRWLENPADPDVGEWIAAQNRNTRQFLNGYAGRHQLKTRLEELYDYARYELPKKAGDTYLFKMGDGLQNQPVLYMKKGPSGEPKVVLDPNTFSDDGTVALYEFEANKDGTLLAYSLSASGSDRQEIRIRNLKTLTDNADIIKWCRFSEIAWVDNERFCYSRFPEPGTVPPEDEANFCQVYCHRVGTPQSEDKLIYERPDLKELAFWPKVTEDGQYLVLHVYHGTDTRNRVYYQPLQGPVQGDGDFVRLLDDGDATYNFVGNDGTTFYFHTNYQADKGRVIAIDIRKPERQHWQEIVSEQADTISDVKLINDRFVICHMHDAHHLITLYDKDGKFAGNVPLPTLGSVTGIYGKARDEEMLFGFSSFLYPNSIFRYSFSDNSVLPFFPRQNPVDPDEYQTSQVFFHSKDGTKVPMFLVHKKGLVRDGSNPALLYGYGGFNISVTPSFSPFTVRWLEMGGVYAVANLRGGGEYGEAWHRAGMLENKQNVFDDFIAAAQWLIENSYTNTCRLAIYGRSNGGLLVSACMMQRPELFGAVLCGVPVTDMLRFHRFTVGRYWTPEYGNAETNPEHFRFLYAYSPLHNVKPGVTYPNILITTADTDDRVVPAHAMKLAATLQEHQEGDNHVLLRVEVKAGHGHGKPISKVIDEQTDMLSFLALSLKMA